jgi:hypothetical protein
LLLAFPVFITHSSFQHSVFVIIGLATGVFLIVKDVNKKADILFEVGAHKFQRTEIGNSII